MRAINEIIVHCSATAAGKDYTVKDIDKWHRERGWQGCGYHYVITLDGTVQVGRKESAVGAHASGHNSHSIGVCYIGGLDPDGKTPRDTRTRKQKIALTALLCKLRAKYPTASIHGHRDFAKKACPCFDATKEYAKL